MVLYIFQTFKEQDKLTEILCLFIYPTIRVIVGNSMTEMEMYIKLNLSHN